MSGISSPTDPRLTAPGLDQVHGQVALDQPQQGVVQDPGLQPAPAAVQDAGEGILQARAWDQEGPHHLDSESDLQAQFSALSLADAAAQAPEAIAAPLEQPAVDAA